MNGVSPCPRIIALPGFVHQNEKSRVDELLEICEKEHGFKSRRVHYSAIERRDNRIICHFNLSQYVADLYTAIQENTESPILVFASSMSAAIVGHYIAQRPHNHGIVGYASVSPLPGWKQYANEKIRTRIIQDRRNVPLTGKYDVKSGVIRYIPAADIPNVQEVNALEALATSHPTKKIRVITFVGTQDEVTPLDTMHKYHRALGGSQEDIKEYACGHDIPRELYQNEIITFFKESLATLAAERRAL